MDIRDTMPAEIELKLILLPGADAALQRSACFDGLAVERRHETTRYFDTPDLLLQRHGMTLRVRSGPDGFVQTLKVGGSADGPAGARGEWEWPATETDPALDLLAETPAAPLLPDIVGRLTPVLVTDIHRDVRRLRLEDGTEVESAHDRGAIIAGRSRAQVNELELELKRGTLAPLYRLAIRLHETVPMRLAPESKSARGYRLRSGAPAAAYHAPKPKLAADVLAAAALRDIVAGSLGAILANVAAAETGEPEGVHQFRVGLRRLRSALVLFAPHLEPHATRLFAAELRRLGQVFGARRDWDVFCLETLRAFGEGGKNIWADMLRTQAEKARAAALTPVVEALHGRALTGLVLGIAAWCEGGVSDPAILGPGRWAEPLSAMAPDLMDRLARKVARRAQRIETAEQLHDLRKSFKKLRYACDFVTGLYDEDAVRKYRHHCSRLQETLGSVNDARVTPALAERLTRMRGIELASAVAALATWNSAREHAALQGLREALDAFADANPFWR